MRVRFKRIELTGYALREDVTHSSRGRFFLSNAAVFYFLSAVTVARGCVTKFRMDVDYQAKSLRLLRLVARKFDDVRYTSSITLKITDNGLKKKETDDVCDVRRSQRKFHYETKRS